MLINNIKLKYYDNLLDKLINASDFEQIKLTLESLSNSENSSYHQIVLKYLYSLLDKDKFKQIFNKNLIWINSFNEEDAAYLNNFIFHILTKNQISCNTPNSYAFYLSQVINQSNSTTINFQNIVEFSYFYQYLISRSSADFKILNSSGAFFETSLKRYFTHYNFTKAYFYVVRNPLSIFKERKSKNVEADASKIFHGLLSSDTSYIKKYDLNNHTIEENTQNWSINVSSWASPNVTSTFRGFVLRYEDILTDPRQILAEVIGHLVQSGLKIHLNYQDIDNFINDNPLENKSYDQVDVSNKELKLLRRDLGDVSKKFGYVF